MNKWIVGIYVRWYNMNVGGSCPMSLLGGQKNDV